MEKADYEESWIKAKASLLPFIWMAKKSSIRVKIPLVHENVLLNNCKVYITKCIYIIYVLFSIHIFEHICIYTQNISQNAVRVGILERNMKREIGLEDMPKSLRSLCLLPVKVDGKWGDCKDSEERLDSISFRLLVGSWYNNPYGGS